MSIESNNSCWPYNTNRGDRRAYRSDPLHRRVEGMIERLQEAGERLRETEEQKKKSLGIDSGLTYFIFNQQARTFYNLLSARQNAGEVIESARFLNRKTNFVDPKYLDSLEPDAYFLKRIRGVSLSGIERMPPPLSPVDVQAINGIFHQNFLEFWLRQNRQNLVIAQAATVLATQAVLEKQREGKDRVPSKLRPLFSHLHGYFDYYTDIVTDFSASKEEDELFILISTFKASLLRNALGSYIPARLGITPSSATKLYRERALTSAVLTTAWGYFIKGAEVETKKAFSDNGLPLKLRKFQHYDEFADRRVTELISNYYQGRRLDDLRETEAHAGAETQLLRLKRYWKDIIKGIKGSPEGYVVVPLPPGHIASSVTLAQQYHSTLIMILSWGENSPYLTMEVDNNRRVFGIPPMLIAQNPRIRELLIEDVLSGFLEKMRQSYPHVEFSPKPVKILPPVTVADTKNKEFVYQPPIKSSSKQPPFKKVPGILAAFVNIGQPVPTQEELKYVVAYSEEKIKAINGKLTKKQVEQIMKSISRFEYRQYPATKLTEAETLYELKVAKDWRVILEDLGGGKFSLYGIEHRSKVFNTRIRQRNIIGC